MRGFDTQPYSTVPTQNAALTIALTRRLMQQLAPELAADADIAEGAERMRTRANAFRTERLKELDPSKKVDARPLDKAEDNRWSAIYKRLDGCAEAGVEGSVEAADPGSSSLWARSLPPPASPGQRDQGTKYQDQAAYLLCFSNRSEAR